MKRRRPPGFRDRHLRPLLRRTWIPLVLATAFVLVVVLGLPWYYKTYRGALPDRGLTPAEVEWARAYAPWRTHVRETLADAIANRNSVDGELGRILDRIAGCGERLWTEIGTPPSERLDPVAQNAAQSCAAADAAREEYRAANDTPSWRTSAALNGADVALSQAEFALRRLMLALRPLERRGGPGENRSRIEPLLSDALSAEQPTEVICWSEEEWPQVRAELAAVGLVRGAELRADVNAYRFRVHASPRICRQLVLYAEGQATAPPEVARALLAVLSAARYAVAGAEDDEAATCEALQLLPQAATRLGAPPDLAAALPDHVRDGTRCS